MYSPRLNVSSSSCLPFGERKRNVSDFTLKNKLIYGFEAKKHEKLEKNWNFDSPTFFAGFAFVLFYVVFELANPARANVLKNWIFRFWSKRDLISHFNATRARLLEQTSRRYTQRTSGIMLSCRKNPWQSYDTFIKMKAFAFFLVGARQITPTEECRELSSSNFSWNFGSLRNGKYFRKVSKYLWHDKV